MTWGEIHKLAEGLANSIGEPQHTMVILEKGLRDDSITIEQEQCQHVWDIVSYTCKNCGITLQQERINNHAND